MIGDSCFLFCASKVLCQTYIAFTTQVTATDGNFNVAGWMCRVPEECPQEIADLVQQCKAVDPRQRPSARQAFDIIKANFAKKR